MLDPIDVTNVSVGIKLYRSLYPTPSLTLSPTRIFVVVIPVIIVELIPIVPVSYTHLTLPTKA